MPGVIVFGSPDHMKLLTVTSAYFGHLSRGVEDALAEFRASLYDSILAERNGCFWTSIEERSFVARLSKVVLIEAYDQPHAHRVVCKLVAAPPWMLQATFHDLQCLNLQASKLYFYPIIESVEIHDDAV